MLLSSISSVILVSSAKSSLRLTFVDASDKKWSGIVDGCTKTFPVGQKMYPEGNPLDSYSSGLKIGLNPLLESIAFLVWALFGFCKLGLESDLC